VSLKDGAGGIPRIESPKASNWQFRTGPGLSAALRDRLKFVVDQAPPGLPGFRRETEIKPA